MTTKTADVRDSVLILRAVNKRDGSCVEFDPAKIRSAISRAGAATGEFSDADVAQLGAIADLLAGIVEKGRQQQEAEQRAAELKAIDQARAELIALVTHELRTPLAVVRAYTDLLAEERR